MKTVNQIEDRIRLLLREELQRRLNEAKTKVPRGCKHNHRQPLDSRRLVYAESNPLYNRVSQGVIIEGKSLPVEQTIGLCMLNSEGSLWNGTICEDDVDAQGCPYFEVRQSPEEIYRQFREDLEDEQWVVVNLPRIQPLLWVLGAKYVGLDQPLPWWRRLWLFFWNRPALAEGAPATVEVYLPPPASELINVDPADNSPGTALSNREGTPSDG